MKLPKKGMEVCWSYEGFMNRPLTEEEAEGYVPISGGNRPGDIETGAEVRERSWYNLIGTALKHIWPRKYSMKARVLVCVVIVILQRLVNLAVPILCKPSLFLSRNHS